MMSIREGRNLLFMKGAYTNKKKSGIFSLLGDNYFFLVSKVRHWTFPHLKKRYSFINLIKNLNKKIIKLKLSQKTITIHFPSSSTLHSSKKIIRF